MSTAGFTDLLALAAHLAACPLAVLTLRHSPRSPLDPPAACSYSRSGHDLPPLCWALAAHVAGVFPDEILAVPDLRLDPRLAPLLPLFAPPHPRYLLRLPLLTAAGEPVGALCLFDLSAHLLPTPPATMETLRTLVRQIVTQLQLQAKMSDLSLATLPEAFDRVASEAADLAAFAAAATAPTSPQDALAPTTPV